MSDMTHDEQHAQSFRVLCAEINAWQSETFPHATVESKAEHLRREVEKELRHDPSDPDEIADCLMLLIGICGKLDLDPMRILRCKLEINKNRRWGEPDADGVVEHIRETT